MSVPKRHPTAALSSVYLGDGITPHQLELTWLRDMDRPYELGDNEIHLAFQVDDFDAAFTKAQRDGLRLLRKSIHGNLLYRRSRRLLAGDCTKTLRVQKSHLLSVGTPHGKQMTFFISILFSFRFCQLLPISYIICNTNGTDTNRNSCLLCFDHLSATDVDCYMSRCPTDISRLRIGNNRSSMQAVHWMFSEY